MGGEVGGDGAIGLGGFAPGQRLHPIFLDQRWAPKVGSGDADDGGVAPALGGVRGASGDNAQEDRGDGGDDGDGGDG